jgi:hypothetical protein
MSDDQQFGFAIDVPVRNEWANVSLLVTSVQNCFNAMFSDVDGSQTVAMVTGELLENAIKYGQWTRGRYLRLSVSGGGAEARVSVENPADRDALADLQRTLDWIKEFPSAEAAYRARLLALAQTTDPEVSKLGLIRVAYEGRCVLTAELIGDVVRVTARVQLDEKPAPESQRRG